jgi:hypothetical protein
MRQAPAQAEQVRTWRIPETQPMRPNPMRHAPTPSATASEQEGGRSGMLPAGEAATAAAQFLPLDPGIVSATIPAFFIGRNKEGYWVARDAGGRIGGIFLLESSAVAFARKNSRPGGCVTIFPSERIELDLENNGNPLLPQLLWLKAPCGARPAGNGRLHQQYIGSDPPPVEEFSCPLDNSQTGGHR